MNACFFDMDGTLIDSRADLAATVNHTRRDLGLAELPEEEVLLHVGQGAAHLLEHAIPECAANAGIRGAFCTFGFGKLREARYALRINRMEELLRHLKAED